MRVLVTGAGGFAGGHIARRLAAAGFDVIAATRSSTVEPPADPSAARRFKIATLALENRATLPRSIDAVVHAAATSPWAGITVEQMIADNVIATRGLIQHALEVQAKAFVLCSSVSVFGTISAPVLTEAAPVVDPGTYGATKLLAEQMLADVGRELPSLAIRLPAVVGRGSKRNWPSECLRKLVAGEPLAFFNPNAPFNNVVHEMDLAALAMSALISPPRGCDMVLAAAGGCITVGEAVQLLAEASGSSSPVTSTAQPRHAFLIDASKAGRLHGFAPISVAETLRRFVADDAGARS